MGAKIVLVSVLAVMAAFGDRPDYTKFVRPEMGTVNTGGGNGCNISTGNLFPMIARPWGFGGWSPQSRADYSSRWFYDYADPRLYGIRQTRQPSPWIGDHGCWYFLPITGKPAEQQKDRCSWYSHKTETFNPGYYSVYLADFNVKVELTPVLHGAVARFTYGETKTPGVVVCAFKDGKVGLSDDKLRVTGFSVVNNNHRGHGAKVCQHFVMEFDRPAENVSTLPDGALHVSFAPVKRGDQITARIASSLISPEQAALNLWESEVEDFDMLVSDAKAAWNLQLGKILVEGDDIDKIRTFYTCLYRTMLFPLAVWEQDADNKVIHWSPTTGEIKPGYYYAGTGFWDTFRALFPLLNFLSPGMNAWMTEGLQHCWEESGWLPEWSSPGLSDCMLGNNSASVVTDAWLSGVRGNFDINELWKAVVHGANNAHPKISAVGRKGVEFYNEKGYIPRDVKIGDSVARTLEYAYDDWCIAQLAKSIGRPKEEVELYERRSQNWRNVFDPQRKITVGRNSDGSFAKDFDPFKWEGDFREGCALHYTWCVFHDVAGLVEAMGGKKEFVRRLDEIFELPPSHNGNGVSHEFREMLVMDMGQYAHGNQPIQHMIYLYDWADALEKTQHRVRWAMEKLYRPTPDGYCGDEDNGQTSAWYVWSAMGMYPVCPGSGEYALGAPLFDRVIVNTPAGKQLVITAPGAKYGKELFPVVKFNGEVLKRPFVKRADLQQGGVLSFE